MAPNSSKNEVVTTNDSHNPTTSTIDKSEIDFFTKYSKDWMSVYGIWKILHLMNKVRVPLVVDGLISAGILDKSLKDKPDSLKNIKILDVGCGAGILTEALAYLHADIVGLEVSDILINAAEEHKLRLNTSTAKRIEYVVDSIEAHSEKLPATYDVVIASEVVEHVNDIETFLQACAKALKPGGSIFITTINRTWLSFLFAKLIGEYFFQIIPIGTHSWFKFVKHEEVAEILQKNGCVKHGLTGLRYELIKAEWSFWSNTGSSYAIHMVKSLK